jgi:dTMP kinase
VNPLFIIEGPDGAGKSTLISQLAEALTAQGYDALYSRQPGGTPAGETFRGLLLDPQLELSPMTQALLFYASRQQAMDQVIRPALNAGRVVLTDRFELSTLAYQTAKVKFEEVENHGVTQLASHRILQYHKRIHGLNDLMMADIPRVYILVDASDATLTQRRLGGTDRFESQNEAFFREVRAYYREWYRTHQNDPNVCRVDTDRPKVECLDHILTFIKSTLDRHRGTPSDDKRSTMGAT